MLEGEGKMIPLYDLLQLKYPDINTDFMDGDFQLHDLGDGLGARIIKWNLPDPEPTAEDLAQWAIDLDFEYRTSKALEARIYPPITDQLDMLYHDKVDGTNKWVEAVQAVKVAHPKPVE